MRPHPIITGLTAIEEVESHFGRALKRDIIEESTRQMYGEPGSVVHFPPGQDVVMSDWDPSEPEQIIAEFSRMLRMATGDGAKKRAAGEKPSWKVDTSHEGAIFSHITKWKRGEKVDADSGAHPLVHTAWRCLAIAYQETH